MVAIFKDELHDQLGTWPLGYIPYGGADYGEIEAIAQAVGDGDDAAFHDAWTGAADRMMEDAQRSEAAGHRASARECFLRAACLYGKSFHPLFGQPVDPRVIAGSQKQITAFDRGLALSEVSIAPLRIPFENASLLAYVIPSEGRAHEVRPLLIFNNGYDGTITDLFFASAVAASKRGYHALIFDGPGQGTTLIEHGVPLRPDWETVIKSVVDFAQTLPNVDPRRIALCGWSLGGYLAPRAASGEHRLAACVADPALPSLAEGFRAYAMKLGASQEQAAHLGEMPAALMERLEQIVASDRKLQWSVAKRGYWVNGTATLRDYFASVELFTMDGRIEDIRCPTLFTLAEHDTLAAGTQRFFDALLCPKTLLRFLGNQGAGEHCEMRNRSLVNRRVLDWLDEVLC
ncbi:alpha/beta hydrolase family protein [Paraburkholderia sp. BCC1885]|uniref:alpha/beta hydrolase family protein n=1 Tax=Paraburkholderia sp. BCC1885 TaxID=2562669 RepID=UPI001182AD39|nr:alpha/beta fold hydrolase [Paraburkholderia sp. BCC1885]